MNSLENKNLKILFIDICNYEDYPTGGQLSFAKNFLNAFHSDLNLVGSSTNNLEPIGKWFVKKINGVDYNYFSVAHIKKSSKKPLVPTRIQNYCLIKKYSHQIFGKSNYNIIMIQAPEVLFGAYRYLNKPTIFRLAGIENPLSVSRYRVGRFLSGTYDNIFFSFAKKRFLYLAAADNEAISDFVQRSQGILDMSVIKQFPTPYNGKIFQKRNKLACRELLNLSDELKLVITVGRLGWFKGWKFMIDSFKIFLNSNSNSKFIIIGDGEDEDRIKKYIDKLELNDKIELAGRKEFDQISLYLSAADLFIMGSFKEGWSTTLNEAVACGLPCVVTQFSSSDDLVHDGFNGFVVRHRDENLFAKKMNEGLHIDIKNTDFASEEIKKFEISNLKESFYKIISNWYVNAE